MASGIGWRTGFGVKDTTGINPYLPNSGWVIQFTPDIIASRLAYLEMYHIGIDGPVGSSAAVLLDNQQWDYVSQGWSNGWDPSQPAVVTQGMTVAFCWNVAFTAGPYNRTTNIQPVATIWLRQPTPGQQILPGLALPAQYGGPA